MQNHNYSLPPYSGLNSFQDINQNNVSVLILEVLYSYSNLSEEDVNWASNTIASMKNNYDLDQLVEFIIRISPTKICGKFSFSFHDYLFTAIKSRNIENLIRSIQMTRENSIPEIYDNSLLTCAEKSKLIEMCEIEKKAAKDAVTMSNSRSSPMECIIEKITVMTKVSSGYDINTIYNKCYDTVCVRSGDNSIKGMSGGEINSIIRIPTKDESGVMRTECWNIIDLIKNLVNGNNMNYSEQTVRLLKDKFNIPIKMYKRYIHDMK